MKISKSQIYAAVILCALVTSPVHSAKQLVDRVVAVVEDEAIFQSDIELALKQFMFQQRRTSLTPEEERRLSEDVLTNLVNDKLVVAQAARLGVDIPFSAVEEEVRRAIDENMEMLGGEEAFKTQMAEEGFTVEELKKLYRQQIRNRKLVEEVLRIEMTKRPPEISDETLRAFYERRKDDMEPRPAVVKLRTIFVGFETSTSASAGAKKRVDALREQLDSGANFEDLARDNSEDPSASSGGDLGFLNPADLGEPAFRKTVEELEVGKVSEPVLTAYGYHLIRVSERRDTGEAHVQHILIRIEPSDEDIAEVFRSVSDIHESLLAGAPFDSLADRYGTDPTAGPGGDLGWLKVQDLPDFFQEVLTGMQPGDVSQVLRESAGFRIVELLDREDERAIAFEDVRDQLRQLYQQEHMTAAYDDYIAGLRERFDVDIKPAP